jgi:hypothetical protein
MVTSVAPRQLVTAVGLAGGAAARKARPATA